MSIKVIFGGFGRWSTEAVIAILVLAVASSLVVSSTMIVEGAKSAVRRAMASERPDVIQVKSRFNRAIFETPRNGNLQPMTLPIYEPLIDPDALNELGRSALVVHRQSLFRNVVFGDSFLNLYLFGIDPETEGKVSSFTLAGGRLIRAADRHAAMLDTASAAALHVGLGGSFPVRKADGTDLELTVVGLLGALEFRYPPPRTVETPELKPDSPFASSGVFVTLQTSQEIFDRDTLTDALVIARTPEDVPSLIAGLHQQFRLEPGIFVQETYSRFLRQFSDYLSTLTIFGFIALATTVIAGVFAAKLLDDAYQSRHRQYAILLAVGLSPGRVLAFVLLFGVAITLLGTAIGSAIAFSAVPSDFQMPSLHAHLGSIRPQIGITVFASAAIMGFGVVLLSGARTVWTLAQNSIASVLTAAKS